MTGAPAHGGLRVRLGDVGQLYSFVPPLVWLVVGGDARGRGPRGSAGYSTGPSTVEASRFGTRGFYFSKNSRVARTHVHQCASKDEALSLYNSHSFECFAQKSASSATSSASALASQPPRIAVPVPLALPAEAPPT